MKHIILGIMGLLLGALTATAQIEVNWKLAYNRTVLMEPVRATIRIGNYSGSTMDLTSRGNARLLMDVEDKPYSTVKDTGKPLVTDPIIIPMAKPAKSKSTCSPPIESSRGNPI